MDRSVPQRVIDAAKAAFRNKSPARLAPLVYDSLLDENAPPEDHVLRFSAPGLQFEVEVSARPSGVELKGRVDPPQRGRAGLVIGELNTVHESPDGSFAFGPVDHGRARISFAPADEPVTQTDWFRV